jgi:hypothetical protein
VRLRLLGILLDVRCLLAACRLHIHAKRGLLLSSCIHAKRRLLLVKVAGLLLHVRVVLLGELLLLLVRQVIVQIAHW